ncbi:MAG TPA: hypothetical protein VE964_07955 [Myxococcales bacterium]|nr:hypothetical protein [Myxococcales bacterium]
MRPEAACRADESLPSKGRPRGCIRYRQSLDEQLPDAPRTTEEYEG